MAERGRPGENLNDDARADRPAADGPERINAASSTPSADHSHPDHSHPDHSHPDHSHPDHSQPDHAEDADSERARRMRRAQFLADLAEAKELRKRVAPRRARAAELHARVLRTFRY